MKARIFSTAILIAMTFVISCNDDTVSPQGPADFYNPTFDGTNKGKTFCNNGIEIWYPAAGYLSYDNTLSAGKSLYCWTATPWPDSAHAINMYFKSGSQNLATNHGMRVIGCSVRCCKE